MILVEAQERDHLALKPCVIGGYRLKLQVRVSWLEPSTVASLLIGLDGCPRVLRVKLRGYDFAGLSVRLRTNHKIVPRQDAPTLHGRPSNPQGEQLRYLVLLNETRGNVQDFLGHMIFYKACLSCSNLAKDWKAQVFVRGGKLWHA
jgi:hypothetical protein